VEERRTAALARAGQEVRRNGVDTERKLRLCFTVVHPIVSGGIDDQVRRVLAQRALHRVCVRQLEVRVGQPPHIDAILQARCKLRPELAIGANEENAH
jgi:hypothetical protein